MNNPTTSTKVMRWLCAWLWMICLSGTSASAQHISLWPQKNEAVPVDARLSITFFDTPVLGKQGWIRIYDAETGQPIDSLDISKPSGLTQSRTYGEDCDYAHLPYNYARTQMATNRTIRPGTSSHPQAEDAPDDYQLNIIGGFTDGFHFHPVLVRGHEAHIYLHNNMLDYGHRYYVTVDKSVFSAKGFKGIMKKDGWAFSIKKEVPKSDTIYVNANGTADFCTVQGALDHIPDFSSQKHVIMIAPGDYEEIVYARNKTNVLIQGAGMNATKVHYANNEVFNPHPMKVKTNEWPGTFPSRRAAFMLDNCHDIEMRDLTVATDLTGQAEGLLLNGERIALHHVHIIGSGDALQANGTVFMDSCQLDGGGDTILGRGAVYAYRTDFRNDGGPFTWVRNTCGTHGDVFVECTFSCPDGRVCDYGRTPNNHGKSYPYAELVVIDCKVKNLAPTGWGVIGEPSATMLEYNTRDMMTGQLVDTLRRAPYSRQLDAEKDADLIRCYRNPAFVLKGWNPKK